MQRYGPGCTDQVNGQDHRVNSGGHPGAGSCWSRAEWPRYRRQSAVDDRSHEVGLVGYCHQFLLERPVDFVTATFGWIHFLFIICCLNYEVDLAVTSIKLKHCGCKHSYIWFSIYLHIYHCLVALNRQLITNQFGALFVLSPVHNLI